MARVRYTFFDLDLLFVKWPRDFTKVVIIFTIQEHSVEEVLERATGYPKVAGSNHSSGDFSLQPQWNPYPTLTPPSCWVRHVRSIGDPQYGLVVCCVVSACDSTDSREISNDGKPSLHFTSNFLH
jgi:hypothetical protein